MIILRKLSTLILIMLFACSFTLQAQTFQKDLRATLENEYVACLYKQLSGEWVYHVAYHLGKDGKVTNIHWNIKHAELWDSEGNRYNVIDTGNDNIGSFMWDLFNNINAYNEGYNIQYYDVEDGWLPLPDCLPSEGHLVSSAFKFMGNGEKFTWTILWQVHINANGDLTAEVYREIIDCN